MHHLEISVASQEHQATILAILQEVQQWLRDKGLNQWTLPFTAEWVANCVAQQQFFIATVNHDITAVFRLVDTDPSIWEDTIKDAFYIHSLAVRRHWKGHGIGNQLLQWIEAYATQNQRKYLRLDCFADNEPLCHFYQQAGFNRCGTKEMDGGESVYKAQLFEKAVNADLGMFTKIIRKNIA